MANEQDYVELGKLCGEVCGALYERLEGRQPDKLDKSLVGAIEKLTE